MYMNKTEKLLAARKRLKEFQQKKSYPSQDNGSQQKDLCKSNQSQNLSSTIEALTAQEFDSMHSPASSSTNIDQTPKESPVFEKSNVLSFSSSINNSPISNSKPANEQAEIISYFSQGLEANATEEMPEIHDEVVEKDSEVGTNVRETREQIESIQSDRQHLPREAASPPPKQITLFPESQLENGAICHSPSLQKGHLLQMASAVADALQENSECAESTPLDIDLEYRNQFLSSCLEEQKHMVNQLRIQVSHYSGKVAELEAIVAVKDTEFEAKLLREVNPLKEQLQVYAQTTGILVAEKAELTAAIDQCQTIAQRKSEEVEELSGKLKNSQNRVAELGKELVHVKNTMEDTRKMYQQLYLDHADLDKKYNYLRKIKEDDELEVSELRQEVSFKNAENLSLQRELDEKNNLLSLNELKIQQLTNSPQEIQALENQHNVVTVLEQQLSQLRDTLQSVDRDKEEAAKQYESYVQQLDLRYEKLMKENESLKKRVDCLEEEERDYMKKLSELQENYEEEREKREKLQLTQSQEGQIDTLTKSLDNLTLENSNLQTALNERDTIIESLKRDVEEMRILNEDAVEKSKLVSALESEQIGASRAVSQNLQLKVQLSEMHDAFVTLSNSKLDLTEQLQAERTIGRKLNARLNLVETEIEQLKENLKQKERIIEDMEREKLQAAQIADQMHHYQAQSNQARTLQQELQNSLGCIEILRRENQQLSTELQALKLEESEQKPHPNSDGTFKEVTNDSCVSNSSRFNTKTISDRFNVMSGPQKKLEIRFKEAMERVAELTDEKQTLEHLVLQLQCETETIGEYVTLYQEQRAILQKKAQEREVTFRQLVEQRNRQQEQLHQLKLLVSDLIRKKSGATANPIDNITPVTDFENDRVDKPTISETSEQQALEKSVVDVTDKTTSKILDLLTEIKDCKDTCILEPNFHPCPWCSGKLITV